jgi:hypothetical protein
VAPHLRKCEEIEEADMIRERQFDLAFSAPLRLAAHPQWINAHRLNERESRDR